MNLDDINAIKNLDRGNAAVSIDMLPKQINQAWVEGYSTNFPDSYKKAKNIVIAGMGGSAYGARILKSLYEHELKIPINLVNGYHLPAYVDKESLVFLSSYSGTTEETISCASEAFARNTLVSGVTSGGKLAEILQKYPSFIFNPKFNPSSQPRIGVGYMVVGLLALLSKLEFINLTTPQVMSTITFISEKGVLLNLSSKTSDNEAKKLAQNMHDGIPVFTIADFLEGAAHAIRNPINETGKQFGLYFTVPELNHHLMEGLAFPQIAKKYLKFIFVESNLYEMQNQKRMKLTRDVVEKNGIETQIIELKSRDKFTQSMELIQFGGWFTFYLAILNNIDPSPVPWVDYFKEKLLK
ncbi:hypothetical protein HYW54_04235 [Candidatus Gottesmanbacteria bacterium]|nr:hypothetical protein [Candidatus Gottesmanbacteria bacterium]